MRFHSLLIVLTVARTTAYDYGEDITLCWAKQASQSTSEREDCRGAAVLWGASGASDSSALENKLLSSVAYQVTYRAVVPQQRTGHQPALSIPHGNIHSCLRKVGFCTPFVKNTKELSTHSPALTGEFELGAADGVFRSTLTSEVQLEEGDDRVRIPSSNCTSLVHGYRPGTYTVIAHVRWFENGTQHDMARAALTDVSTPANSASLLYALIVVPTVVAFFLTLVGLRYVCGNYLRAKRDAAAAVMLRAAHVRQLTPLPPPPPTPTDPPLPS